ncbi:tetratricopeptide repeat protein [Caulobacter sp. LARHSG274]
MRPIILAAALLLTGAAPALAAQTAAAPARPATVAQPTPAEKQEAQDREVVQKAMLAFSRGPLDPATVTALQQVIAHAPAAWPLVQKVPDGQTIVRLNGGSMTDTLSALLTAAGSPEAREGKGVAVAFNTYGVAALMLGSRGVSLGQPQEALTWLERGLAFQPDNLMLVTEKGMALALQRRFAEALAFYDAQPPQDPLARPVDPNGPARLLRARGYCLIELGRLDEAEAAYKASLELEPDHGGAKNELAYIRDARAGKPPQQPGQLMTGEEAKTYPAK